MAMNTYESAYESYLLCEAFAALHELPVEYIWMEFVDPTVANSETVTKVLDVGSLLVYH
jgi:hypothetical protein